MPLEHRSIQGMSQYQAALLEFSGLAAAASRLQEIKQLHILSLFFHSISSYCR